MGLQPWQQKQLQVEAAAVEEWQGLLARVQQNQYEQQQLQQLKRGELRELQEQQEVQKVQQQPKLQEPIGS
ncbi:unnamed protein product [Lampetra fluviatilis]